MRPSKGAQGGVGYVLRKFPVLSETFILGEILALEAEGVPVHIFALERPNDPRFHEDLPKLKASITYVPDVLDVRALLRHNLRVARSRSSSYSRAFRYALATARPTLLWRLLQAGYIASEARRLGLHHLHAHFANRPTTVALLASRIVGIPYSFTAHAVDIFKRTVDARALARKMESARFVVAISEFNKTYLERLGRGSNGRIVQIYNGIDLDRFSPNGGPPAEPFTILSVARLVEKKGLDVLIEACSRLRARGLSFQCWIVGKGRLRPALSALITRLNLEDVVDLLGPHTQLEVLERYHAAHLYVLPCVVGPDGNRDGLPVSLIEALSCGLPVVTTPMTGIPEAVRHLHNGLLVPDGDADALADALEALVRDRQLYDQLRANARPSIAATFDRRQTARQLQVCLTGGAR